MTVQMKVGALSSAKTAVTNLADDIEAARSRVLAATPPNVTLTSMSIVGVTGAVPTWLREQAADPLNVVLDLARLLDEDGNGSSVFTGSGDASNMRTELGRLIADGLTNVDENDKQGMQDYADMLERYKENDGVMSSVMSTLGRDGTEDVLNQAEDLEVDIASSFGAEAQRIISGWVAEPLGSNDSFEVYDQFLNYSGETLATYSQNSSDPAGLADEWSDAITGNGTDDLMDHPNPENAAALTLLIKRGGQGAEFDDVFLGDLTNTVYDWEKSFDGDAVWGPLNDQLGSGYGVKDPDMDYGDTTTADDNMAYSQGAYDGLANLLGGMKNSPEASERFFTYESDGSFVDQVDYNGQDINEKLRYMMLDRVWPTDDGDGFGIALQNATTNSRDAGDGDPDSLTMGERSARLASQTIYLVGNETGRDDDFYDDGWQIPEGMRDNMGDMLAAYAPDIQRIGAGTGEGEDAGFIWGDGPGENPFHGIVGLSASQEDLATMLQGIGRGDDKEGITAVLTSQVAHHENLMSDGLAAYNEANPDAPRTIEQLMADQSFRGDLFASSQSNGAALAFVLENGVEGGKDDENAREERAQMMSTAFSIGTSFIPGAGDVLGETANHFAKGTYDVIQSEGLSALEERIGAAPEGVSDLWGSTGEAQIRNGLGNGTYNALLNAGFLDPSVDPEYALPEGTVLPPNENGYIQIDPQLYDGLDDELPPEVTNNYQSWYSGTDPRSQPPSEALQAVLSGYSTNVSSWIGSS